eukprot:TRINITY_DN4346_c0_g1_i1.p1 TRINITY_DN4346_c0_g1~~TRINITY_DN4346_c0_g1_i1.p1  ORF type:complete len:361 (+),score=103.12 TRINITY_DN4346_c0_g1_i1:214-1296(+)
MQKVKDDTLKKRFPTEAEVLEDEDHNIEERISKAKGENATVLALTFCKMRELSRSIFDMEGLRELNVHKNLLTELPEELGRLVNLTTLNVSDNLLVSLPASVGSLKHLTEIDASTNKIASVPAEVGGLRALERFRLDFNELAAFPAGVCGIPTLKELYILENPHLSSFPPKEELAAFTSLQLTADNHPLLLRQWESYRTDLPGVQVTWHKIYPDKIYSFSPEHNLFLGSLRSVQNASVYGHLGITHVVTCGKNMHIALEKDMRQLELDLDDEDSEDVASLFESVIKFVDEGLSTGSVIIHCFAGVSRSATMTTMYLMQRLRRPVDEILALVKASRPAINPNPGFMRQLLEYEEQLGIIVD